MKIIKAFQNISLRHAIKTAIACIAADVVILLLRLPEGYWAVISAGIIMQSSIETGSFEATLMLGYERILGTVLGAALGIIGLLMSFKSIAISLPVIFVVMAVATYLTARFKQLKMMGITAIIIIMIGVQPGQHGLMLGLIRCMEIILGCVIAVVVTITIWPHRAKDRLNQKIINILAATKDQYLTIASIYSASVKTNKAILDEIVVAVNNDIASCAKLKVEAGKHKLISGEQHVSVLLIIKNMLYQLKQMAESVDQSKTYLYSEDLSELINKLSRQIETYIDSIINAIVPKNKHKVAVTEDLAETLQELENLMTQLRKAARREQQLQKSLDDVYEYLRFFQANKNFINELLRLYKPI